MKKDLTDAERQQLAVALVELLKPILKEEQVARAAGRPNTTLFDVKPFWRLLGQQSEFEAAQFLRDVKNKKRLAVIKNSMISGTSTNVVPGTCFTADPANPVHPTGLKGAPGALLTADPTKGVHRTLFTVDPAMMGNKTRYPELEEGLVKTTRGRNATTLMVVDVLVEYLYWSEGYVAALIRDTFITHGIARIAELEGDFTTSVLEQEKSAVETARRQIAAERGVAPTQVSDKHAQARKESIVARNKFTEALRDTPAGDGSDPYFYAQRTNMIYEVIFGVNAGQMRLGLQTSSIRDTFTEQALSAVSYAEGACVKWIHANNNITETELRAKLMGLRPLLQSMANMVGQEPVVMHNENSGRVRKWEHGEFEGVLPTGKLAVRFSGNKLLS